MIGLSPRFPDIIIVVQEKTAVKVGEGILKEGIIEVLENNIGKGLGALLQEIGRKTVGGMLA